MEGQHFISLYDRDTNELVGEINVNYLSTALLGEIFRPPDEDPFLLCSYLIGPEEGCLLKEHVSILFSFDRYIYQLDYLFVD